MTATQFSSKHIATMVDDVLADDLYWLPIRHHSPASAKMVEDKIRERKPAKIFLELPITAQSLLPYLLAADTKPPVACYLAYRESNEFDARRHAWWYPLLAYSPELVAIKLAHELSIEIVCIDLSPHVLELQSHDEDEIDQQQDFAHIAERSSFYQEFARIGGYHNFDEAWDDLLESGRFTGEDFRKEVLNFCAAVRTTVDHQLLEIDGSLQREAHMAQCIREGLQGIRRTDAMVICGGFHCFLNHSASHQQESFAGSLNESLVPFSYKRVAQQFGYRAGNRAPFYYERCWKLRNKDPGAVLMEHAVEIVRRARKSGEALSPADSVAVYEHAELLAQLRNRPGAILDDLVDAIVTCCAKTSAQAVGPKSKLVRAIWDTCIGDRIGTVTVDQGRLPIVEDFLERLNRAGLEHFLQRDARGEIKLQLNDSEERQTSAFLHTLLFLNIPFASLSVSGSKFNQVLFKEEWLLQWSENMEPSITECTHYGDTIPSAAASFLLEKLMQQGISAQDACQLLVQADRMALSDIYAHTFTVCKRVIEEDGRFSSLAQAVALLGVVEQQYLLRGDSIDALLELRAIAFSRAAIALPDVSSVPEDEQLNVMQGMRVLAEVYQLADEKKCDGVLFEECLKLAQSQSTVATMRGALLGLRAELRMVDRQQLSLAISSLVRSSAEHQIEAGDLLYGIMMMSPVSVSLGAEDFVSAVSELLSVIDRDLFKTMLPRLRIAFEQLSGPDHMRIVQTVAEQLGLVEVKDFNLQTNVADFATLSEIDADVHAIMEAWLQ